MSPRVLSSEYSSLYQQAIPFPGDICRKIRFRIDLFHQTMWGRTVSKCQDSNIHSFSFGDYTYHTSMCIVFRNLLRFEVQEKVRRTSQKQANLKGHQPLYLKLIRRSNNEFVWPARDRTVTMSDKTDKRSFELIALITCNLWCPIAASAQAIYFNQFSFLDTSVLQPLLIMWLVS